ncbi:hypothetical protein R1sor_017543 [Riccia sorocarpa]|uniref:SRR1-like domain-containing protein n=1 Tax=Riccia sorocarpa TaxID=122646 RepID=A0ABD3IB63_9MARC
MGCPPTATTLILSRPDLQSGKLDKESTSPLLFIFMEEWKVVSRKRNAGRRLAAPYLNSPSNRNSRAAETAVAADDAGAVEDFTKAILDDLGIVDNEEEEEKLVGRMRRAIVKVEESSFYQKFVKQMHELQVMEKLVRAGNGGQGPSTIQGKSDDGKSGFGEEGKVESREVEGESVRKYEEVEMILYGVGSIYTAEIARCQLALALLIKQKFSSIGQLLVYDPIMTAIECRVMRTLGCVPLETNDNGRRAINGPTLFYMPHNEVELYDSVLQTSLNPFRLNQIAIIGNSFRMYSERWTSYPLPDGEIPTCLLKLQEFVEEIPIADDFSPSAFNDTSWHLFFALEDRLLL